MISSAVRGVAASFLGVALFSDILTSGRIWAISLILGGSIYYTWAKHIESLPPPLSRQYDRVPMEELEEGKGEGRQERLKD